MKSHEPKRYFSNIVGPPSNWENYVNSPNGKMELKIQKMFRKLRRWRKNDRQG